MLIWDGVGGGTKKGGRAFFDDGVYHEGGSLMVPAPFHSSPQAPSSLVTLQIKFLTLEFGRTPSNPSKGFATPRVRPKHCGHQPFG